MKYVIYYEVGNVKGKAQFPIPSGNVDDCNYVKRLAITLNLIFEMEENLRKNKAVVQRRIEDDVR